MKSLRFYAAALSLLFTFASCEEEPQKVEPEVKTPEIRVGKTSVNLDSDGAAVNVAYVIENEIEGEKISVSCAEEWLEVNTDKARIITLSAMTNETGAVREAEVVVSYKDAEDVVIEVSQDFFINPLKIALSGDGTYFRADI